MDTYEYMDEIFGRKPKKHFIVIWTLQDKKTRRFKDIKKACDYMLEQTSKGFDVYHGCGMQIENLGAGQRGSREHIKSIPGFYVDIDVAHGVHKKSNLPPTVTEAAKLVVGHGWDPTLIVASGHGLHAWWVFKEPWVFETEDELYEWELLSKRLQSTVKHRAELSGWTIDSTFDSTRVLRAVGTMNFKDPNNPREVLCFEKRFIQYEDHNAFDEYLLPAEEITVKSAPAADVVDDVASNLVINAMAEPPAMLMDIMMEAEPKFKASWQRQRTDLKDDSPSGYAMSLASFAAAAKWSDQDIANLIIAWYRRHGESMEKAMRLKYLAVTIINAKKALAQESLNDFEQNIAPVIGTSYQAVVDPLGEKAREHVNTVLNMKILWLKKYVQEGAPYYQMMVEKIVKGKVIQIEVPLPTHKYLTNKKEFADQCFAYLDFMPTVPNKEASWKKLINYMDTFMIKDTVSVESSRMGRMSAWLNDYIAGHSEKTTVHDVVRSKSPFVHNNAWHIHADTFRRWCFTNRGQVDGANKTKLDLKIIGCKEKRIRARKPEATSPFDPKTDYTTIRAWKIPTKVINPKDKSAVVGSEVTNNSNLDIDETDIDQPTLH